MAEDLVWLESKRQEWASSEADLTDQLSGAQEEIKVLHGNWDDLQKQSEELKNLALQWEEDLAREKEHMKIVVVDLEGRLNLKLRSKSVLPGY